MPTDVPTRAPSGEASGGLTAAEMAVLRAASELRPRPQPHPTASALAAMPAIEHDPRSLGQFTAGDLAYAAAAPSHPLADVLAVRRSDAQQLDPLHRRDLAALLHRAARLLEHGTGDDDGPWSHRPAPSAGGTHPFDLLVLASQVTGLAGGAYRYAPAAAQLHPASVSVEYLSTLEVGITAAARRTTPAPAAVILIANVHRTTRRYPDALTLLLRDAGALLATLHLVASDLHLSSSIIGTAGHFLPAHSSCVRANEGEAQHDAARPLVVSCGALVVGQPP